MDAFLLLNEKLNLVNINDAGKKLFDVSEADVFGKCIVDLMPDIKKTGLYKKCRNVLKTGESIVMHQELGDRSLAFKLFKLGDSLGVIVSDATERKRAEEAVKAERQRFNDVLDTLPAYLVLLTPDYHVPFANRFFRERFGESHGRRCFEYLFNRTEPCEICETYKVLKDMKPLEWEWTGPDDRNYYIFDYPFSDTGGSTLIMEVGIDITEHKHAEKALKLANAYNRSLIEASLDPLVTIGPDGKITDVNTATEAVTGYSQEQLIGTDFCDYFTEPEKARAGYQQVFRDGKVRDYALDLRHRDGQVTSVLYNASVYRDKTGKVIGVFAAARDIAERKQAEEALQISETRYRRLFEAAQDGILLLDAETGQITEANPFIVDLLGYSREELLGKKTWEIGAFKDIQASKFAFGELQSKEYIRYENLPVQTKDGRSIAVEFVSNVYLVSTKRVIQCNIRDITERKRVEEELRKYREHLEELVEQRTRELREMDEQLRRSEKLAVLGQLAGGVGHELRNPLGAIKNAAYFLNMVLEQPMPEVKETLEILDKEVASCEHIISSLLEFARQRPPLKRSIDIGDVIQSALSHIKVPENVKVVSQLDSALPPVFADPDQLSQVFSNLILNAVQAMPERGQLIIRAGLTELNWMAISFTDTGVGIPPETIKRLFEPLFTTKVKGIGLGLPIVKTLVEGHKGTIEVQSKVGAGSTFIVKLPMRGE